MHSFSSSPARTMFAGALLLASTLTLSACSDIEASTPATVRPQPVQVMTVDFEPAERQVTYTGTLQPRYESDLGFRVAGKVTARHIELGETVQAGDLLAELDATDLDLSVSSAGAELHAARSSLERAEADVERYRTLFEKRFIAQAALDEVSVARDEAASRLERAARALELSENQMAYAELRADHDGVVTDLPVEAGQVVSAGQPVLRLARRDAIDAVIAVPEHRLDRLAEAEAHVELWGDDAAPRPARLREIAPQADLASRTFEARFELGDLDPALVFGRTVTVSLEEPDRPMVASLPLSAVLSEGEGPRVFRVKDDGQSVEKVAVEVLRFAETGVLVSGGIDPGDRIVSLGLHRLDAALPVRVVEERAALTAGL
jgi:multidrug efflux system membrane fusion protein